MHILKHHAGSSDLLEPHRCTSFFALCLLLVFSGYPLLWPLCFHAFNMESYTTAHLSNCPVPSLWPCTAFCSPGICTGHQKRSNGRWAILHVVFCCICTACLQVDHVDSDVCYVHTLTICADLLLLVQPTAACDLQPDVLHNHNRIIISSMQGGRTRSIRESAWASSGPWFFYKILHFVCSRVCLRGVHRALFARCAKSRLFSTTGSHGSEGPEFCTLPPPVRVHQGFFFLSLMMLATGPRVLNSAPHGVLNWSYILLQVGGFQGSFRDKQRNNWRCVRALPALCENAPME